MGLVWLNDFQSLALAAPAGLLADCPQQIGPRGADRSRPSPPSAPELPPPTAAGEAFCPAGQAVLLSGAGLRLPARRPARVESIKKCGAIDSLIT